MAIPVILGLAYLAQPIFYGGPRRAEQRNVFRLVCSSPPRRFAIEVSRLEFRAGAPDCRMMDYAVPGCISN